MAEAADTSPVSNEILSKEAPQLVALLKELKEGLDVVRSKIEALTAKVKADCLPTKDGISYLEAKHLLLLNYCQSLIYYLLRKAKGFSIDGHPVVKSLVEIRLFLEKIRPIDKKLEYQIKKLSKATGNAAEQPHSLEKENGTTAKEGEEFLKYRPRPDLLVSKTDITPEDGSGVYKPPKIAPASMTTREERNALRKEQQLLRQSRESAYVRDLMNDLEGKPEEVSEVVGAESRELTKYMAKMEERARQEEDLFTRAPLTKLEKKRMKHMKKSRNGLLGLSESFYDEIKSLPLVSGAPEQSTGFDNDRRGERRPKKQKRKH